MKSFYEQLNDRTRKRIALLVDPDAYDNMYPGPVEPEAYEKGAVDDEP